MLAQGNQVLLTIVPVLSRISLSKRRFSRGRRCGVPTLSQRGEEGDWHARIAD
jgi:hypothetical protein